VPHQPLRFKLFVLVLMLVASSALLPSPSAPRARAAGKGDIITADDAVRSKIHPGLLPQVSAAASGRLIVSFSEKNVSEAQARGRLARYSARLDRWLPELGLARVEVPPGLERALAERLETDRAIRFATEDRKSVSVADTPLDERWGEQWGPQKVRLPAARAITRGDPSVVIAIVDTGVNYNHWDLREQMWVNEGESEIDQATGARTCLGGRAQNGVDDDGNGYVDDCLGYNFDGGNTDPQDQFGHGTVVAGIAGAATNNRGSRTDETYEGIAGMGGDSRLMSVRALDASGLGWPFNIAEAIRYAVNNGASVVNLSLTLGTQPNPNDIAMLCAATDYAIANNVLVVAASGNNSRFSLYPVSYPAACPGVVAVGASAQNDTRADFSNGSDRLDLVAPGVGITSTLRTGTTAYGFFPTTGSGTSFAAPHVAGAAALVRALRPAWTPDEVRDLLRQTSRDIADAGFDPLTGWGRLDAGRATERAAVRAYLPLIANP
jgi:subtilisin family serine protease